jgi:hypothetical protein
MFKPGDWIIVAGAAVMLVFGLALDWATVDIAGETASGNNPFDYFFTGGLAWLLVVGAGTIVVLLRLGAIRPGTTPWPLIILFGTGLAALLMLIRLILGAGDELGFDLGRGAGMWVAFFAAAVTFAGAVMIFTESGGKLSDVTDIERLRSALRIGSGERASSSAPPPPPPGSPPPPPPSP